MSKEERTILYDSPEAAVFKTGISGWVSSDGRFFGKDEHLARWNGCTHKKCEDCNNYAEKNWVRCEECRRKRSNERYNALPYKEWDGKTPICTWDGDVYFFSDEDLIEWLYDNECNGSDVQLVCAQGINYRELDYETITGDAHEDWEPENELRNAVNKLNEVIRKLPPHSYTVGEIRTSYDYTYKPED
jgi:hypothetical protein